jgi:hypothetical protein
LFGELIGNRKGSAWQTLERFIRSDEKPKTVTL